jgi:beta-glucosidase
VEAWYPGECGGEAIADVLFGDFNPSGRLPLTFYKSAKDLPQFVNYSMKGRTYRYFKGDPLYPFGFGLSFSKFKYEDIQVSKPEIGVEDSVQVSVRITNSSEYQGEEVVQLYVKDVESSVVRPLKSLRGIRRIALNPGESKAVSFMVKPEDLSFFNTVTRKNVVEPGVFELGIGRSSADYSIVNLEVIE